MKSQGLGNRRRDQSKFQQSDENKRAEVDRLLVKYGFVQPKVEQKIEPEEVVIKHPEISTGFTDLTKEYRNKKLENSFISIWNENHKDRPFESLLKNESTSKIAQSLANQNMIKMNEFINSEDGINIVSDIKNKRSGIKLPFESDTFKKWLLWNDVYERSINDYGESNEFAIDAKKEMYKLAVKFSKENLSTVESIKGLQSYINSVDEMFDKVYESNESAKNHYGNSEEFKAAMFTLLRQGQAKDKAKYDSGQVLSLLSSNVDFLNESMGDVNKMFEQLTHIVENMSPEEKVATSLPVKETGETGAKPKSKLVESYKPDEDIPKDYKTVRKNDRWFEGDKLELSDLQELVGYDASWSELAKISEFAPTKGDIDRLIEISKKAMKVDDIEFKWGNVKLLPSKINYDILKITSDYLDDKPNFNKFYHKDLVELARLYPFDEEKTLLVQSLIEESD